MSTPAPPDLTPTSYAMLGLLAIQPWTTYELAKQMRRSVHWFWPRAERKLYDEPKRLAALGLASSESVMTGRRAGRVYAITDAGRTALRSWLSEPASSPTQVEMESLVRVFFADAGSPAQLRSSIAQVADQSRVALEDLWAMTKESSAELDAFPDRRATNALSMELIIRIHEATLDWAEWATAEAGSWPAVRRGNRSVAGASGERGRQLFAAARDRLAKRLG